MKIPVPPYQIHRITKERYSNLHRLFLGIDISERDVCPIHRKVYYVHPRDPLGRQLVAENTPARCMYRTGEILCLYDMRIPLTEARLVHEFIHRIARRRFLFLWTSGLDTNRSRTHLNEILTEYLTSLVLGERYSTQVDHRNLYLPYLSKVKAIEASCGREALIRAYLNGDVRFFGGASHM